MARARPSPSSGGRYTTLLRVCPGQGRRLGPSQATTVPRKPPVPLLWRQDSPVQSSSKPKFEKVPTVSSSQISNHLLSSSQDLRPGDAPHRQSRATPAGTPLPPSPPPPALSPASTLATSPGAGAGNKEAQRRQQQQRQNHDPHHAADHCPPGDGHLAARAENQCVSVEKQLAQGVTGHRPSPPSLPGPLACTQTPSGWQVGRGGGGAAVRGQLIGLAGCGRGSRVGTESHRQAGPLLCTRHWPW